MNVEQILQSRESRRTRVARPFANFMESYEQCFSAGREVLAGSVSSSIRPLIERSIVISGVTAIEVYFKDSLDLMFKYCNPEFFAPKLKAIHPEKYDIDDLLAVYKHTIHPLEVVISSQSFQNVDRIDKVFSKFVERGLWASVLSMQVRLKDKPENVVSWDQDNLLGLRATFDLRHQLVHNPARKEFFSEKVMNALSDSFIMVFGADVVLTNTIQQNKDPAIDAEQDEPPMLRKHEQRATPDAP